MVLSFAFLELGQSCVSSESAWLTPVVLRSAVIDQARVTISYDLSASGPAASSQRRPKPP